MKELDAPNKITAGENASKPKKKLGEHLQKSTRKNVISQWLDEVDSNNTRVDHDALFDPEDASIDVKTELNDDEIAHSAQLLYNESMLEEYGVETNVFSSYLTKLMRLKVSRERRSRMEYVDVHKNQREDMDEGILGRIKNSVTGHTGQ